MATRRTYVRDAQGQFAETPGLNASELKIEARKAAKRERARKRREAAKEVPVEAPVAAVIEKPAPAPAPASAALDRAAAKRERARARRLAAKGALSEKAPVEEKAPEKVEEKAPEKPATTVAVYKGPQTVSVRDVDPNTFPEPWLVAAAQERQQKLAEHLADPKRRAHLESMIPELRQQVQGPIQMRVPASRIKDIVAAQRFKTMHEGKAGIGKGVKGYKATRTAYENEVINTKGVPNSQRPIYGFVEGTDPAHADNMTSAYGEWTVVLNEDVKERSTVTFGDSLNGMVRPIPFNEVETASTERLLESRDNGDMYWADSVEKKTSLKPYDYTEVQVHGGVKAKDIKTWKVDRSKVAKRLDEPFWTARPDMRDYMQRETNRVLANIDDMVSQLRTEGFDVIVS